MSLTKALGLAKTEEDVKDAYIKALGLQKYNKSLQAQPPAGWYQVRRALEANADSEAVDFDAFKEAYAELSRKLRPQVFELGFLRA